jgi:hypothetical protein
MRKPTWLLDLLPFAAGAVAIAAWVAFDVVGSALAVLGVVMLTTHAVQIARRVGWKSAATRAAIGASLGPWLALAVPSLTTADALSIAVVTALFAVVTIGMSAELRRDGPLVWLGLKGTSRPG